MTLPCKSDQNSSIVIWNHFPFGAILSNTVYLDDTVLDHYRGRFNVITGSGIGESILTILGVSLADSGKYTCTTGKPSRSLELIVLGKYGSLL